VIVGAALAKKLRHQLFGLRRSLASLPVVVIESVRDYGLRDGLAARAAHRPLFAVDVGERFRFSVNAVAAVIAANDYVVWILG
jgi:hypothetical protein